MDGTNRGGGDRHHVHLLPPADGPQGWPGNKDFQWTAVNYTPIVIGGVLLGITLWWQLSAKHWFTGPKRTIDLPAGASSADELEYEHEHHGEQITGAGTD